MRLVYYIFIFLCVQLLRRAPSVALSFLQRVIDFISPVKFELAFLATTLFQEYNEITLLIIEPIGTGLLYIIVFFSLVKAIYPDALLSNFQDGTGRLFKAIVSFHVLAVYVTWVLVLSPDNAVAQEYILDQWFGLPAVAFMNIGCVIYFGLIVPISIGTVLSRPAGGLRSRPSPDSGMMSLKQGIAGEAVTPNDIDSPIGYWCDQGVWHSIPIFLLGVLFIFFDMIFPIVEILLAIGVIATLSPLESFPPGQVDQYDIEARFAEILEYATVNLKGIVAALFIVIGLAGGGLALTQLTELFYYPIETLRFLSSWNHLGVGVAIVIFAVVLTLTWLSLADRLPWFITSWNQSYESFEGREVDPDGKIPRRFSIGLTIPSLWIISSLIIPFSTINFAPVMYAIAWPIFMIAVARKLRYPWQEVPPDNDNNMIMVSFLWSFLILLLSMQISAEHFTFGLLSIQNPISSLIVLVILLTPIPYYLPEMGHKVNERYRDTGLPESYENTGKQGRQRKARLLYSTGITIPIIGAGLFALYTAYDMFPVTVVYFILVLFAFCGIIYHLDANRFHEEYEADPKTEHGIVFLTSITILGGGIVQKYFGNMLIQSFSFVLILAGIVGMCISSLMIVYHWLRENNQS